MPDHNLRKDRIGGSEAPAVFNAHQYMTPLELCLSKRGQIERPAPNIRMIVGKALEQGILNIYEWKTGRKVQYHDKTVIDPTRRYMAATPDAFCVAEKRGVDAKLVWWDQRALWGDDQDSIPLMYVIQAWYYCAAFDVPRWDIAALVGMDDFRVITVERDPEVERVMLKKIEAWHARYVLGGEMPQPNGPDDTDRWLQAAYPNHKRPDVREADADEAALLQSYVEVRVKQKELKACQDEMERALKRAIQDREGLRWAEGQFTWRKTKDGESTDWESMSHWLMHKHVAEAEREKTIADYTHPKPGFRKIRIDHPALKRGGKDEDAA